MQRHWGVKAVRLNIEMRRVNDNRAKENAKTPTLSGFLATSSMKRYSNAAH